MKGKYDIDHLIKNFFDGKTSIEEECWLYGYYSTHQHLPQEQEQYRMLFSDFSAMQQTDELEHGGSMSLKLHRLFYYAAASVAAVLLFCMSLYVYNEHHETLMLAKTYEGSYIIEKGKRIDNLERILPDIRKALNKADQIETAMLEKSAIMEAEQTVLDNAASPEEKERLEKLLNE